MNQLNQLRRLTTIALLFAFSVAGVVVGQDSLKSDTTTAQSKGSCPEGLTTFYLEQSSNHSSATFKSKAPLEDIVGTTNQISGRLCFDPDDPEKGGGGYIQIPVASLETGIPLRDEDLQNEDWLHAEKYPYIEFDIAAVRGFETVKSDENSASYDVTVVGEFSVHGRTKTIEVPARVTYLKESAKTRQQLPGDLLAARAEFRIALADFAITGPSGKKLIGSKVGEEISIEISLITSSVDPSSNPFSP